MEYHNKQSAHAADFLFVTALFAVFALTAVLVLLMGARVYKSALSNMDTNYTARTSLTYVAEKIRQNDSGGEIAVRELDGLAALTLPAVYNNEEYVTYIYEYDGALRELFVRADSAFSPDAGASILETDNFSIRQVSDTLFYLSVTDSKGVTEDMYVTTLSRASSGQETGGGQ